MIIETADLLFCIGHDIRIYRRYMDDGHETIVYYTAVNHSQFCDHMLRLMFTGEGIK